MSKVESNAVLWWSYDFPHTILVYRVQFWETGTCYCAIWDIKHSTTSICNIRDIQFIMDVSVSMCYMAEIRINLWHVSDWRIFTHLHNACHQNAAQIQFYKNTHTRQEYLCSYVHSHGFVAHIHQTLQHQLFILSINFTCKYFHSWSIHQYLIEV